MKPHDCEDLNDIECWHVDLFRDRLDFWRARILGDATCFRLARIDAQKRFSLEPDEAARMDQYIASRFGNPKQQDRPEGEPVPLIVAR